MIDSTQLELIELSKKEYPHTWQVLELGLSEGVSPGFVAGFWQKTNPNQIHVCALGQRRQTPSAQPMLVDTVFDLASLTKVFATATLTAVLVERGWISWSTPICAFFSGYPHEKIEVRHLLAHTAGFVDWQPFWEKIRHHFAPCALETISVADRQKVMRELVLAVSPQCQPDIRDLYSDISFLLLGFLLEEVTQMPLDEAVSRFVWQPMGIQEASYRRITQSVLDGVDERVAATENCSWRGGVVQGQVHDDNCWAMGGYGGHAGAFGTARDLLHFSKSLLEGFLSPPFLQAMWTRVPRPPECTRTLGWDTPSGETPAASHRFSPRSIGHLGFTGTSLWIDPGVDLAIVLLSNRVHPTRENTKMKAFRPRFHEALRGDHSRSNSH